MNLEIGEKALKIFMLRDEEHIKSLHNLNPPENNGDHKDLS